MIKNTSSHISRALALFVGLTMLAVMLLSAAAARASTTLETHASWSDGPFDFYRQVKLIDQGGGSYQGRTKIDIFSSSEPNFYIVKARIYTREWCNISLSTDTHTTYAYYNVDPSPNWGVEAWSNDGYANDWWDCLSSQAIMSEGDYSFPQVELYDSYYGIDFTAIGWLCLNIRAGGFCL